MMLWSKNSHKVGEGFLDAVRGFVDDGGVILFRKCLQERLAALLERQKSQKPEIMHMEP